MRFRPMLFGCREYAVGGRGIAIRTGVAIGVAGDRLGRVGLPPLRMTAILALRWLRRKSRYSA